MRARSSKRSKVVLFVDDEIPWLRAVKLATSSASFNIMTAESGEVALKKMYHKKPDLILSDVRMPFMNGFDLFEIVKNDPKLKSIPYVFMSSIDDFDAKQTARKIGADGYIEKPFESSAVEAIVFDLLTRFKNSKG